MSRFGIIFDLDGTLWDPSDVAYLSWKTTLDRELNGFVVTKDQLKRVTGMTTEGIGETLFPDLDVERRNKLVYDCIIGQNDIIRSKGGILFDNVKEELEYLSKDNDLYIVSNCQSGYIESFLEYYKIKDLIKDIECYGNNGLDKKDNIKLIIERNNIENSVYVGDTSIDYESAKYNNIPFIYCSYGFGRLKTFGYRINRFTDLRDIIDKIKVNK